MSGRRQSESSSASEDDQRYAGIDEKKSKRMKSNRESARRSRMKKQKLLQDLTEEVGRFQARNSDIVAKIDDMSERYAVVAAQNRVLIAQEMELAERLKYLNAVIKKNKLGMEVGVCDDGSDPLLKPWQILFPTLPIPASSGLFKF